MGNKSGRLKKNASKGDASKDSTSATNGSPDGSLQIHRRFTHVLVGTEEKKVCLDDFQPLKVLGKGSFGKVMMVQKKDNHKIYAMKSLRKDALLKRNQIGHTQTERFILQNLSHPFLTELQFAFQTADKLYMVLDFMPGGELFFWLKAQKRFSLNRAKLYGAEILLALAYLHSHDIVYRDLKPENILVDGDGHLCLTDFGLSKEGVTGAGKEGGTKTFCGTPEYLAPEILQNRGHGKAVDWWSLGILIYEMMNGLPPFYDQNMQRMYDKILNAPLQVHASMTPEFKALMEALLERDPLKRLGSGPTDAEEIKSAPFFKTLGTSPLSWDAVFSKSYSPEFKPPNRTGSLDVSNFDIEFTSQEATDSYVPSALSSKDLEKTNFPGFTYQGDSAMEGGGSSAAPGLETLAE